MQVSQFQNDARLQLIEAMSLQINMRQLPFDPSSSAFLDVEVAQIIGVHRGDILFLHYSGIIERTCWQWDQGNQLTYAFSYWDMFNATACMSLLTIGYSRDCADQIAFKICDAIAGLGEDNVYVDLINFVSITAEIEQVLNSPDFCFPPSSVSHPMEIIVKKIAIDLLQMHQRSLTVLSVSLTRLT
jgi:hypothetical protein